MSSQAVLLCCIDWPTSFAKIKRQKLEKRFIPLGNMETNPRIRRFGLIQGKIRRAIQMGWKCRGYVWKYYNEGTEGSTTIEPWFGFGHVVE